MSKSARIRVFSPATIANVGPGFDIFGLALHGIGDTIEMEISGQPGIRIENGEGCEGLPTDPEMNVAGVSLGSMLSELDMDIGLKVKIHKNILPGSGLGSSASSSAGAVFALNELLKRPFSREELVPFAMEGEGAASQSRHADNVAPALLGGFTVVRSYEPLDIIRVPVNMELWFTIVHPHIEVKTSDSKRMLKKELTLQQGITQWGNVAGMIVALVSGDKELLGRSLHDPLIEPVRSMLIPGFREAKQAVLREGVIGASISGSGPSIFAISENREQADRAAQAFHHIFNKFRIEHRTYISDLNKDGAIVLE